MRIDIVTIFPGMFEGVFSESMVKIAQEKNKCVIRLHDLREWTDDTHRTVDDKPYGGGGGMVMKVDPIARALRDLTCEEEASEIILLTPQGRKFDQAAAKELAGEDHLILICGHYGGVDERVRSFVTREISTGDYILTCGEIPAMTVTDAVIRLIPGVLGDSRSLEDETFEDGLLEAPRYTRPAEYMEMKVPPVLLCGDHSKIKEWEHNMRVERTLKRRPDLLKNDTKEE